MKFVCKLVKGISCLLAFYFVSVLPAVAATTPTAYNGPGVDWHNLLAAGMTITLAVIAGAIAQAKTACTALEAIGRNPSAQAKIFVPMVVALALIESLVIYALVVVFAKM